MSSEGEAVDASGDVEGGSPEVEDSLADVHATQVYDSDDNMVTGEDNEDAEDSKATKVKDAGEEEEGLDEEGLDDEDLDNDANPSEAEGGQIKEENDDVDEEKEDAEQKGDGEDSNEEDSKGGKREASSFMDEEAGVSGDEGSSDEDDVDEPNSEDRDFIAEGTGRRRKKKKKRRKKRKEAPITQDTYDLIHENTGRRIVQSIDADVYEDDNDDEEKSFRRLHRAKRRKGSEHITARNEEDLEDELFGSDMEEDEGQDRNRELNEEDDEKDNFVVGGSYGSVSEEMEKLEDIFGEGVSDFLSGVRRDHDDEEDEDAQEKTNLRSFIEPSRLDAKYLTELDVQIKKEDIPERLQARMRARGSSKKPDEDEMFEEAKWINMHAFEGKQDNKVINQVLQYIKEQHWEIPVIANTRREYCPITDEELWRIDEWDEKWDQMYFRREKLMMLAESGGQNDVINVIQTTCLPGELNDVHDYLLSQIDESKMSRKYTLVKRSQLDPLVNVLSMTPKHFGENLTVSFMKHDPPATSESESPEDMALQFLSNNRFPSVESVLERARRIAAARIALHPLVRRHVREVYEKRAMISTTPTRKGLLGIDWVHKYYPVHRLKNKPFSEFKGTDYLLLHLAKKQGFINVKIEIQGSAVDVPGEGKAVKLDSEGKVKLVIPERDVLMDELAPYFCEEKEGGSVWNNHRRQILWEAISLKLHEFGLRHVRNKLLEASQRDVITQATNKLIEHLETGQATTGTKILSCCVGGKDEPSVCVVLSADGELRGHLKLSYIKSRASARSGGRGSNELYKRKMEDVDKFTEFVEMHQPDMCVISADSLSCRYFKREVDNRVFEYGLTPHFVDPEIGRIYAHTERSNMEFKEMGLLVKQAISVGRFILDPISELSAMMSKNSQTQAYDIMSMNLHPLQGEVPGSQLLRSLTRAFISYVNFFGVDINSIMDHPHKKSVLQFVCGLGPRKAQQLYSDLRRRGAVRSREDMVSDKWAIIGPVVNHNCISFIKVSSSSRMNEDDKEMLDPLDATRIHPEDYMKAKDIVEDVWAPESDDEEEEHEITPENIIKLSEQENYKKLDFLDLESWAQSFETEGKGKVGLRLQLIKNELKNPFSPYKPRLSDKPEPLEELLDRLHQKNRRVIEEPDGEFLFSLLTSETKESLRVGMMVTARVRRIITNREPKVSCLLESGIPAFVFYEDLSDKLPDPGHVGGEEMQDMMERTVKADMVIQGRIKQISYERFSVDLVTRTSALQDKQNWEVRQDITDPYLDRSGITPEEKKMLMLERKKGLKSRRFIPRNVTHPLFRNVSNQDAIQYLKANERETVVIRPSTQGADHLTLTWKMGDETFVHYDIKESKKPDPMSLGEVLVVDGKKFEDLDEIIVRYVEPMEQKVKLMTENLKFLDTNERDIEDILFVDKESKKTTIPYYISFSTKHPGYFLISYIPNKSVRSEYIKPTPKGFKFRELVFPSPKKLIKWFKRNFHKPTRQRSRGVKKERSASRGGPVPGKVKGTWNVGAEVIARYEQDGRWYAAKIHGCVNDSAGQPIYTVVYNGYPGEVNIRGEDIRVAH